MNNMLNSIWKREAEKFELIKEQVKIPNETLENVDYVELKIKEDFEKVPSEGGCYWILTNDPVYHRLHRNRIPEKINDSEVIYNGIAKDNVMQRVKHHLLAEKNAGWSGISLDILLEQAQSHRKKVLNIRGKVPYVEINGDLKPIRDRALIFCLNLSKPEKEYIESKPNKTTFFFRNGINVFEDKHKNYIYKVYFITGVNWLYLEYAEKKWREKYGLPKLCSYSSGR